jgi:hypothetical protein
MGRLWRLRLTLCYDSHSVLWTLWHVKGLRSAEAKSHTVVGVAWPWWEGHFFVGVTERPKPFWQHSWGPFVSPTFLKSCLDVRQSRWGNTQMALLKAVWQGLSTPQNSHIVDRARTQGCRIKNFTQRQLPSSEEGWGTCSSHLQAQETCSWLVAFLFKLVLKKLFPEGPAGTSCICPVGF